jgi:hypothetical protein
VGSKCSQCRQCSRPIHCLTCSDLLYPLCALGFHPPGTSDTLSKAPLISIGESATIVPHAGTGGADSFCLRLTAAASNPAIRLLASANTNASAAGAAAVVDAPRIKANQYISRANGMVQTALATLLRLTGSATADAAGGVAVAGVAVAGSTPPQKHPTGTTAVGTAVSEREQWLVAYSRAAIRPAHPPRKAHTADRHTDDHTHSMHSGGGSGGGGLCEDLHIAGGLGFPPTESQSHAAAASVVAPVEATAVLGHSAMDPIYKR